jgi:hypothetical protein
MTEKSKKEFRLMMCEVLEEIVLPQIQEIRDDIAVFKAENQKEHKNTGEDIDDLKDTTTRTELKLNSLVKRQDDQGDQVIKINKILKLKVKT